MVKNRGELQKQLTVKYFYKRLKNKNEGSEFVLL